MVYLGLRLLGGGELRGGAAVTAIRLVFFYAVYLAIGFGKHRVVFLLFGCAILDVCENGLIELTVILEHRPGLVLLVGVHGVVADVLSDNTGGGVHIYTRSVLRLKFTILARLLEVSLECSYRFGAGKELLLGHTKAKGLLVEEFVYGISGGIDLVLGQSCQLTDDVLYLIGYALLLLLCQLIAILQSWCCRSAVYWGYISASAQHGLESLQLGLTLGNLRGLYVLCCLEAVDGVVGIHCSLCDLTDAVEESAHVACV